MFSEPALLCQSALRVTRRTVAATVMAGEALPRVLGRPPSMPFDVRAQGVDADVARSASRYQYGPVLSRHKPQMPITRKAARSVET
jgi:hypothetical protein